MYKPRESLVKDIGWDRINPLFSEVLRVLQDGGATDADIRALMKGGRFTPEQDALIQRACIPRIPWDWVDGTIKMEVDWKADIVLLAEQCHHRYHHGDFTSPSGELLFYDVEPESDLTRHEYKLVHFSGDDKKLRTAEMTYTQQGRRWAGYRELLAFMSRGDLVTRVPEDMEILAMGTWIEDKQCCKDKVPALQNWSGLPEIVGHTGNVDSTCYGLSVIL